MPIGVLPRAALSPMVWLTRVILVVVLLVFGIAAIGQGHVIVGVAIIAVTVAALVLVIVAAAASARRTQDIELGPQSAWHRGEGPLARKHEGNA
jgi:fatty acid desaturase